MDGEWWRDALLSFVSFHPTRFPLPPTLVMQLAKVSSQKSASVWTQLPWRWAAVGVYVLLFFFFFFFFFPSFFFFFFFFLPSLCFSQSWWLISFPVRSALSSSSVWREEEKDRVRQRTAVDGCAVVGEGWMSLCAQVNCLGGQGLTQWSRCVYMPPFTAIWMWGRLLPSNITVLFSS